MCLFTNNSNNANKLSLQAWIQKVLYKRLKMCTAQVLAVLFWKLFCLKPDLFSKFGSLSTLAVSFSSTRWRHIFGIKECFASSSIPMPVDTCNTTTLLWVICLFVAYACWNLQRMRSPSRLGACACWHSQHSGRVHRTYRVYIFVFHLCRY